MNKNEQAQQKDVFAIYKDIMDKAINSINQSVPRYHQSITNTQQEVIKSLENNMTQAIQIQQELATKSGMSTTVPDASIKAIKEAAEGYLKISAIYNQMALSAMDAAQQSIKSASDNSKSFNDIAQSTMRSYMSAFAVTN